MKKGLTTLARTLAIFFTLLLMAAAGAQTGIAAEFHCRANDNKCNVTIPVPSLSATIVCMQDGRTWQCVSSGSGIHCTSGSSTKQLPSNHWSYPAGFCTNLCGNCSTGWRKYEGGGSTF